MKYIFFIISILVCFCPKKTVAQEQEYETIFSKKANRNLKNYRLYGTLYGGYWQKNKNDIMYRFPNWGLEAGLFIKKKIGVGIFNQSIGILPNDYRPNYIKNPDITTFVSDYGLSLSYLPNPQKAVHLFSNLKLGGVSVVELRVTEDEDYLENTDWSPIILPMVGIETNLFPWGALQLGGGYRWVAPKTALGLNYRQDFSGPFVQLGFKLGNIR